ncbi:MAG TPA: adenine deaminase [Lentisphaeria bacterium]|nr:MAG: adenine deaminase [Lentisphaerae bacterium GWF2_38_69]HBM17099.1 adenine deaminase [Lentisphaeria bacterium]
MDDRYERSIRCSLGEIAPDLVLRNASIVDVMSGKIRHGAITIKGRRIVGLYEDYTEYADRHTRIIDLEGRFAVPGLIEPHIHMESSMLTFSNFATVVLQHGTTTVINDPHELANVLGKRGIRHIINEAMDTNLRSYFTVPSCVPALGGEFEESGAVISSDDVKSLLLYNNIIGLGEVMNYPGVVHCFPDILAKISETYRARGYKKNNLIIDGHCPTLKGKELTAYINAGIMGDHECSKGEELEEKLSKGLYVMLRDGSSAQNMEELLDYVIEKDIDTRRLLICSDDKNPHDLISKGHLDHSLRKAVALLKSKKNPRINVFDIIRMVTMNAAEFFDFKYLGKLSIQSRADIAIFDDIESFRPFATIANGKLVYMRDEIMPYFHEYSHPSYILNSVNIDRDFSPADFRISSNAKIQKARVIKLIKDQIVTEESIEEFVPVNGEIKANVDSDILKIAVINRHNHKGNFTVGLIKGFGLKEGAVASTVGHDSHNLGVIGTNDADMDVAIEEIKKMQGGIAVVKNGRLIASMELRFAGLMSVEEPSQAVKAHLLVDRAYKELGGTLSSAFLTMGFLQLPVIPELKITDKALVKMTPTGPEKVSLLL